jgi:SAM-dependent methyltransferase
MSEVLEHVFDQADVLQEVSRVLKDNGTFLITVPYDYFLGPFFILFNLKLFVYGIYTWKFVSQISLWAHSPLYKKTFGRKRWFKMVFY